ncbi:MAG: response regulator transcription factor [Bacteroidota bacterium]
MKQFNENSQAPIRVLIADDQKLLREAWAAILESDSRFSVAGLASDGDETIQQAAKSECDIILMDVNMKPVDGFETIVTILQTKTTAKIIAVSMNVAAAQVKKIMQIGVHGYVNKNAGMDEFKQAIIEVHHGGKYICSETKNLLAKKFIQNEVSGAELLSNRELAVIQFIKKGLSSREIASQLGIASRTIEAHRYNILKKFRLPNTAALINTINQLGI